MAYIFYHQTNFRLSQDEIIVELNTANRQTARVLPFNLIRSCVVFSNLMLL